MLSVPFSTEAKPELAQVGGKALSLIAMTRSGLPVPPDMQGRSLVPQLHDPRQPGKAFAVSQHPHPSYGKATHMGYALRTARHRYVEWRDLTTGGVTHRELYDHEADPWETRNRIADPAHRAAARELEARAAALVAAGGRWPVPGRN